MKSIFIFLILLPGAMLLASLPGYDYVYPSPGAQHVSPDATIIIRFEKASPQDIVNLNSFIQVYDGNTLINGQTSIASDGHTIIFQPDAPFAPESTLRVSLSPKTNANGKSPNAETYEFRTSHAAIQFANALPEEFKHNTISTVEEGVGTILRARIMPNGVSVPADFPHIKVTSHQETAEGYIYASPWLEENPYSIIFDNSGSPVWYARREKGDRRWDFKVQENGLITMLTRAGEQRFLSYDQNFQLVHEYKAAAGYTTDEHEFIILENGHYFLIGYRTVTVDMSQYVEDALSEVQVKETTLQEFTADHQLILNWSALENLKDGLAVAHEYHRKSTAFSFPHMNAIDIDEDGHILLSSRNLDEITKINRQTGDIIWRLGGEHNQFTFVNDPMNGFNWQHDIRSLGDGYYSLFDNGREHNPSTSRAVIYELDTENKTATLTWEHRNPPGTDVSLFMGNFQKLPNGNAFINWGMRYRPKATEVTPDGNIVYEMNFANKVAAYRTHRFPWRGKVEAPYLIVDSGNNYVTLIFNKFGDADVDYYNIYGGTAPNSTTLLDTSRTTLKHFYQLENQRTYYFRVTAVSSDGTESSFSEEKTGFVTKKAPGENLIDNGDFSQSTREWLLELGDSSKATWEAISNEAHIQIEEANAVPDGIAFRQGGFLLARGEEYILEFDARADAPKAIGVRIHATNAIDKDVARIGNIAINRRTQQFSFRFFISSSTILDAELSFLLGSDEQDVYLDNIQLKRARVGTGVSYEELDSISQFKLLGNYPNPFNMNTTIQYRLDQSANVELAIYNLLGQKLRTLVHDFQSQGEHFVKWDGKDDNGRDLSSGAYLYRLRVPSFNINESRKIMLLR